MRRFRLPVLVALAMVCLALPAQAQIQESPIATPITGQWTVTPFLSVTFGGDSDTASLGAGGSVGYFVTPELAIEGEFGWAFDLAADDENADWSLLTGNLNGVYHFPLQVSLLPYVTAGVGFGRSSITFDDTDSSSTEIGFNVGGGAKLPLTDALAARADIRYFRFNDAAPDGFRVYGGLTWRLR